MSDFQRIPRPTGARIETGPLQIGDDDWPGVFIRGDDAAAYHLAVGTALGLLPAAKLQLAPLRDLHRLLGECRLP